MEGIYAEAGNRAESLTVFIVDDDKNLRGSLSSLLRSVGIRVCALSSAEELHEQDWPDSPACILLDVRLKGVSGLVAQDELARTGIDRPIIFMTGYGDIPITVKAMKAGAFDFLAKPFREQELLDAVRSALDADKARMESSKRVKVLQMKLDTLTARERQVMELVAKGLLNKQIADKLGLSEITVKIYRGKGMRKMGATSLAVFLQQAMTLHLRGNISFS